MEDNVIVLLKSINATLGRIESTAFINENKPADTGQNDQSNKSTNQQKGGMLSQLNSGLITGKEMAGSVKDIGKNLTAAKLGEAAVNLTKFSVALLKYKLIPGKNSLFKSLLGFLYGTLDELSKFDKRKLNPTLTTLELLGKAFEKMDKIDIKKISKQEKFLKGFDKVMTEIVNTLSKISKKKKDVKDSLEILKGLSESTKIFTNIGKGMIMMSLAILTFIGISKLISMMLGVPLIAGIGIAVGTFIGMIVLIAGAMALLSKNKKDVKNGTEMLYDISISMMLMSGSIILLGLASLLFSTEAAKDGFLYTIGTFLMLTGVMIYLSKKSSDIIKGSLVMGSLGLTIAGLAVSTLMIAGSAYLIGKLLNNKETISGLIFIGASLVIMSGFILLFSKIPKHNLLAGVATVMAITGIITMLSISMLIFAKAAEKIAGNEKTLWTILGFMSAMLGIISALIAIVTLITTFTAGIGAGVILAATGIIAAIAGIIVLLSSSMLTIATAAEKISKLKSPEKSIKKMGSLLKLLIYEYSNALSDVSLKTLGKSLLGGNKMLKNVVKFISDFVDVITKFKNFKGNISEIASNIGAGFLLFMSSLNTALTNAADIEKRTAKKVSKILTKKGLLNAINEFAKMIFETSKIMNPKRLLLAADTIARSFSTFLNVLDNGISKDKLNIYRLKRLTNIFKSGGINDLLSFFKIIRLFGQGKFKGDDGQIYEANAELGKKAATTYLNVLSGFVSHMELYKYKIKELNDDLKGPGKNILKFIKNTADVDLKPIDELSESINKLADSLNNLYKNIVKLENKNIVIPISTSSTTQGITTEQIKTTNNDINNTQPNSDNNKNITNINNYNSNGGIESLKGKTIQFIFNDRSYEGILNII